MTKAIRACLPAVLATIGAAAIVAGALLPWTTGEREFIAFGSKPSLSLCRLQTPGSDEHLECLDEVSERQRDYEAQVDQQRAAFEATYEIRGRQTIQGQLVLLSGLLSLQAALALIFVRTRRLHGVLATLVVLTGLTGLNVAAFVALTFQETARTSIGMGLYISIAGGAVASIAAILSTLSLRGSAYEASSVG